MDSSSKRKVDISAILAVIPESPGCYMYFDEKGTIIYVGKAKNLKRRVSSYFNKTQDSAKTRVLVKKIRDIRYIVVESEDDALLLENNLIKEHRPRYNVMLKDDKTYPWIVVRNEAFARVFQTRTVFKDKSIYYGPYPSGKTAKFMLKLISDLYPIRNCRLPLTKENIEKKKFKVCLQYHIKKCKGPCEGLQSEEDYNQNIQAVHEILKGNLNQVSRQLYEQMIWFSEKLKFEDAEQVKQKYLILENYKSKSIVVSPTVNNVDVYTLDQNEQQVYVNYLHIVGGSIVQAYTIEYKIFMDEPKEEMLGMGIRELRSRFKSKAREVIVPFLPDVELEGVDFVIPQRGDKKKLLELSQRNVSQYKMDQLKQAEKLNPDQRYTRILMTLQKDLHLKELPVHIECFDNSNTQGTNPVAACVVFKMGRPSKKDYRHFNVKTVEGPNDYASMYEIVTRRYTRLLDEGLPLPQLIVVDGGKGQLSVASEALQNMNLYGKIPIIGIAEKLEEIYFPHDSIPLYLDKNSESLKVIQYLRDEAHRFGITFHRNKRSKQQVQSELDSIKGIGELTKEALLKKFKSVKKIREASVEDLSAVVGKHKAEILVNGLNKNK